MRKYDIFISYRREGGYDTAKHLFSNYDDFLSVGITRAIFAVPGHFCDGVLMGYYYSLVKFYPPNFKEELDSCIVGTNHHSWNI